LSGEARNRGNGMLPHGADNRKTAPVANWFVRAAFRPIPAIRGSKVARFGVTELAA